MKRGEKMETLQENIKSARLAKGLSLNEMAQAIGISPSMLCQVEKGIRMPSISMLFSMAETLNCSLDELAGRKNFINRKEN